MQSLTQHARFGELNDLEHAAAELMTQGYTKNRPQRSASKEYYLGPENPEHLIDFHYVLLWQSAHQMPPHGAIND